MVLELVRIKLKQNWQKEIMGFHNIFRIVSFNFPITTIAIYVIHIVSTCVCARARDTKKLRKRKL